MGKADPQDQKDSQTLLWLLVAAHHLWPSLADDRRLISICSLAQNSSVTKSASKSFLRYGHSYSAEEGLSNLTGFGPWPQKDSVGGLQEHSTNTLKN